MDQLKKYQKPDMPKDGIKTSVLIPSEAAAELKRRRINVSALVRDLITEYLRRIKEEED